MPADILGVGHCCQDSICLIEDYPQEDGSTHILQIDDTQGGGAVATAMVAAARLGAGTGIITNLGSDDIGDKILDGFRREGVDTGLVKRIPGGRSPSSIVMVNSKTGSRTKFPYRDGLPDIEWTDGVRRTLETAKVLHLDGTQYHNALAAARLAKELGLTVSLDACSMQTDNRDNLVLAGMADILIADARYPLRLTRKATMEEALLEMAGLGAQVVAATMGRDGCYFVQGGRVRHLPAFRVDVADTTGAGDTFHGAFLAQWLRGCETEDCLRFAAAAAALKCLRYGGRVGIPTREATERFLAGRGL
jgi:sugar/nucleoside kinase (ribokinase family)